MHRSICFSFIMVSNYIRDTLGDASFKGIPLAFLASWNYSPNSVLFRDLSLHANGLCSRMYWHRIAAAAAAAAAAFRGGRGFPHRGGNGFPKHARRVILRFNIVRILWALPVIYHGRFGRFETHIIEVFFLRAQRGTAVHNIRVCDDEFHSQVFRDHDLPKSMRSILEYSVVVLALQYQEHQ